ncbi:MAG: VOC family protein [Arthrobacter sp.]|jgi:hypothetical protein|nr:VOC family protein [Arthrobacter sp.]
MAFAISHTSIDCVDAYALSEWWKAQLGYEDAPGDPNEPGHEECWIQSADGSHALLFLEVPEHKAIKNRLHFDVRPTDRDRDAEVTRLLGAGASLIDDRRHADGTGWAVLQDPEGNEFCVLRSQAELGRVTNG